MEVSRIGDGGFAALFVTLGTYDLFVVYVYVVYLRSSSDSTHGTDGSCLFVTVASWHDDFQVASAGLMVSCVMSLYCGMLFHGHTFTFTSRQRPAEWNPASGSLCLRFGLCKHPPTPLFLRRELAGCEDPRRGVMRIKQRKRRRKPDVMGAFNGRAAVGFFLLAFPGNENWI